MYLFTKSILLSSCRTLYGLGWVSVTSWDLLSVVICQLQYSLTFPFLVHALYLRQSL